MDRPTTQQRRANHSDTEYSRPATSKDLFRPRDDLSTPQQGTRSATSMGFHSSSMHTALDPIQHRKAARERALLNPVTSDLPVVFGEIKQPRKNLLNSNVDNLEIWPGGHDDRTSFNKTEQPLSTTAPHMRRGQKPRLLLDLETFVDQELRVLNCASDGPSETRIQVFRSCFDMFIETFTTYKPLLSRIKYEYDHLLEHLQMKIQNLVPKEVQLMTIREENDRQLKDILADNRRLRKLLEEEKERCKGLEGVLEDLRAEVQDYQIKLVDLEKEFEESTETARDLETRLRNLQAEFAEISTELREVQIRYDDKASELERARKLFDDMVPKEQLSSMTKDLVDTRKELAAHSLDYDIMKSDHREMSRKIKYLSEKTQLYEAKYTPRPDLTHAQAILQEFGANLKTTADIMHELCQYTATVTSEFNTLKERFIDNPLEKAGGSKDRSTRPRGEDMFNGLGTGPEVPKYLRFKGKLRNRHIPKPQLEAFIKEVMAARMNSSPEESALVFEEHLYIFLQKKFGVQSMIAEWGYSLLDALRRFDYDADCELFMKIIQGEVGEDVYYDQQRLVERLQKTFAKADVEINSGKGTGVLNKNDVKAVLKKLFPLKTEDDMNAILKGLDTDNPGPMVEYELLFAENKEGDQGAFLEEIRDQNIRERAAYLKDIEDSLKEYSNSDGHVNILGAKTAFLVSDPKKPKAELTELVCRAFKIPSLNKETEASTLALEDVMKNLRYGVLRRSSRKDGKKRGRLNSVAKISSDGSFGSSKDLQRDLEGSPTGSSKGDL